MVLRKVVMPSSTPNPSSTISPPSKQPHDYLPVSNPMPSYWLQQPHPYATLRTTPSLPTTCDIAIIGSGMAGVLTAYHILQSCHKRALATGEPMPRVVLLDARDLCSGATARNGGHAKVKTATLAGMKDGSMRTALANYVQRVIYELKTLVEDEGHHTPSYRINPHLTQTYNIAFAPSSPGYPTGTDYLNPRPDGTIVVGGGSWFFAHNKALWYNTVDDSISTGHFPASVYSHWTNYMADNFLGWEESKAQPDCIWTGIQAMTPDGMPHVGRVPGADGQWMLCGFNGGGMAIIPVVAKAVAKMVVEGKGFEDVKGEFGLLEGFKTGEERML
ncbi:hypothetical protein J4E91_008843 [Alternaria rosae]|nr:hypothetical protein J4E91_008843 [Alternaria rosae]